MLIIDSTHIINNAIHSFVLRELWTACKIYNWSNPTNTPYKLPSCRCKILLPTAALSHLLAFAAADCVSVSQCLVSGILSANQQSGHHTPHQDNMYYQHNNMHIQTPHLPMTGTYSLLWFESGGNLLMCMEFSKKVVKRKCTHTVFSS